MLESTMQDFPLTIAMILQHGRTVHGDSEVVTFEGDSSRRASFVEVAGRAEQLAAALQRLGIEPGDRVGTFQWNTQEHLEAYLAVPTMGAVLHTLNIRLFPEQLTYVVNHAEDRVVIVDDTLIPLLANVAPDLKTVEHYVVVGEGDASALVDATAGADVLRYDEVLAAEDAGFAWPEVDERRPRPCATRAALPATPRASCTRTGRRCCIRSASTRPAQSGSPSTTGCCRSYRCSTPTPGACRTRRGSQDPTS